MENLPKGLYETYERILSLIDAQGPDVVRVAQTSLRWLAAALRPLTLTELNNALTIEMGSSTLNPDLAVFIETAIVEICSSLVDYNESSGVVSLSHFTVQVRTTVKVAIISTTHLSFQEYLTRGHLSATPLMRYTISIPFTHRDLTLQTLTYLLLDDFNDGPCQTMQGYEERTREYPLYEYAACYWFEHLTFVHSDDEEIYELFKALTQDSSNEDKKISFHQANQLTSTTVGRTNEMVSDFKDVSPIFYPIYFRHIWVFRRMAEEDPTILNSEILGWGLPLTTAVMKNYHDVVEILLDLGADVNLMTCNYILYPGSKINSLYLAAKFGHESILTLLLERGAVVNVRLASENETVLHAACYRGIPRPVRQLLDYGADVNAVSDSGVTPLHHATSGGNLEVIRLIVEAGCNVRAKTLTGQDVLVKAFGHRKPEIVQYLLEHGADLSQLQSVSIELLDWFLARIQWHPVVVEVPESRTQDTTKEIAHTAMDVLKVEYLLRHHFSLPSSIATSILDYAQYWIYKRALVQYPTPHIVRDSDPQPPVLSLRVSGRDTSAVRRIVFTTCSHDQG